jgi:hypothetical protein
MPSAFSSSFPLLEESFMKSYPKFALLAIVLLVVGALFVPAVSAETVLNEHLTEWVDYGKTGTYTVTGHQGAGNRIYNSFTIPDISQVPELYYVAYQFNAPITTLPEGVNEFSYTIPGKPLKYGRVYVDHSRNFLGDITQTRQTFFFDDWDVTGLTGQQIITTNIEFLPIAPYYGVSGTYVDVPMRITNNVGVSPVKSYTCTLSAGSQWESIISADQHERQLTVKLQRDVYGKTHHSTLKIIDNGSTVYESFDNIDVELYLLINPLIVAEITSPNNVYTYTFTANGVTTPEEPTFRTGSVTMTDHNGTSISGFEVTAVNHYTGEEYTVSTDTDVAVISLPMDRTVEIRNPQTGVYEEAPVGYYRFYGQKPGYKMLNEEGVKVSVMSEKYGSYKLCDILVSSDTGPLTGKHQFQLRSASDNSILQTGTISAKSRTTGIWYNTTVTNGIANLVLAYDTSDALSEHAGHYYVYATSPGYEDIDYAVQVAVYPRTIYEVRSIYLIPIGGVPTPGNVTLRIQTISETGQSVDNAEIFIAGVIGAGRDVWDTYTTSWTGFLEVSVPGNSTYDIVARAAGYYDSSRRVQVFTENPPIIEMYLFLSGAPTIEPTTEPTGWVTGPPTTQPTGGIPDEDDGTGGFLMEAVRGIGKAFGVGFATAKIILGMLLALAIGFATAKQLRGGAAEFGLGLLGGTILGILVGLIPVWTIVVLLLVVGLYIGNRYVGGANNG